MIIGTGLLASAFEKSGSDELKNNYIVFASGVSNSSSNNVDDYIREKDLLNKIIEENKKPIIYFSSILTPIGNSPYYKHKLEMENIITTKCESYIIFRIPQIIGFGGNENTLFNYLKTSIASGKQIVTNMFIERALVDVDDLVSIVDYCKDEYGIIVLSKIEKLNVVDLCYKIGTVLGTLPNIKLDRNAKFDNWCDENSPIVDRSLVQLNIKQERYTERLIRKYI